MRIIRICITIDTYLYLMDFSMLSTQSYLTIIIASSLLLTSTAHAITADELAVQFEAYKKQQAIALEKISRENSSLKQQNKTLKTKLESTQKQVKNNTVAVETVSDNVTVSSQVSGFFNNTTIGGYGELHYTNRSRENGRHQEQVNFHRFVLFFGHEFSDNLQFFSELELENSIAGDGQSGEIELEQAYLEYYFNDNFSAKAGLFLMPIGTINETHEPYTFYGVERNEVEKYIIPTTWWEAGIGARYKFDNGLSVDAAVMTGLEMGNDYSVRSGRGKVSKQQANEPIIVARVKYTGVPGLEVAATVLHQTDMGQGDNPSADKVDVGSGTLVETHAIYSHSVGPGVFTAKALYSRWQITINGDANQAAETQYGWYLEPSYRLPTNYGDVGIYGRFQKLDYYSGRDKNYNIWEVGANWWIHENVVLKVNYIYKQDTLTENSDERGFDLGIGYSF
ncbi:MAG: porin [Methylococcales bacterium]|nr:porin [Methylococcales bacterium]